MTTEIMTLDLLVEQRYFYFIALRETGGYTLADYWTQLDSLVPTGRQDDFVGPNYEMQHRRLQSDLPYPRGRLLEVVSVSGDGTPPYLYDVFAVRMRFDHQTYFAYIFPFAALARQVIDRLLRVHGLLKKCEFLKVDLPLLLQQNQVTTGTGRIRTNIRGLQVDVLDDPALTSLNLGGDDPINSSIYRDYLQGSILNGTANLEQCTLACELVRPVDHADEIALAQRIQRAKVHIDALGNFKFYLHVDGSNLATVPNLGERLNLLNCLKSVSINPFHRVKEESEDVA